MIKIKESIKFGWQGFKKNWRPFLVLALLLVVVTILTAEKNSTLVSPMSLFREIATSLVFLGYTVAGLKVVDGKRVRLGDVFNSYRDFKLVVLFVLVNVTYSVLFQLGLLLLIIPGLFLGARLFAAPYLVVDKKTSYIDSFKRSWELTRGKTIKLILFGLALLGVIILGLLALLVGSLVSIAVISIASTYVYRKLVS